MGNISYHVFPTFYTKRHHNVSVIFFLKSIVRNFQVERQTWKIL